MATNCTGNWEFITLEIEDGIGVMTINRPEVLNAINSATLTEIKDAARCINSDPAIDVLILTGSGEKSFVSGADIHEMKDKTSHEALIFSAAGQKALSEISNLPQPTIAAINGYALGGGCELALACDIRIAADHAKIGQPEVNLGIIPGFAGTQRLSRLLGPGRAKELIYSGRIVKAEEAFSMGLVEMVVPKEELMKAAIKMAKEFQNRSKIAIQQAKLAINRGLDSGFQTGEAYEAQAFATCFATEDQKEAMGAFLEKRPARLLKK